MTFPHSGMPFIDHFDLSDDEDPTQQFSRPRIPRRLHIYSASAPDFHVRRLWPSQLQTPRRLSIATGNLTTRSIQSSLSQMDSSTGAEHYPTPVSTLTTFDTDSSEDTIKHSIYHMVVTTFRPQWRGNFEYIEPAEIIHRSYHGEQELESVWISSVHDRLVEANQAALCLVRKHRRRRDYGYYQEWAGERGELTIQVRSFPPTGNAVTNQILDNYGTHPSRADYGMTVSVCVSRGTLHHGQPLCSLSQEVQLPVRKVYIPVVEVYYRPTDLGEEARTIRPGDNIIHQVCSSIDVANAALIDSILRMGLGARTLREKTTTYERVTYHLAITKERHVPSEPGMDHDSNVAQHEAELNDAVIQRTEAGPTSHNRNNEKVARTTEYASQSSRQNLSTMQTGNGEIPETESNPGVDLLMPQPSGAAAMAALMAGLNPFTRPFLRLQRSFRPDTLSQRPPSPIIRIDGVPVTAGLDGHNDGTNTAAAVTQRPEVNTTQRQAEPKQQQHQSDQQRCQLKEQTPVLQRPRQRNNRAEVRYFPDGRSEILIRSPNNVPIAKGTVIERVIYDSTDF